MLFSFMRHCGLLSVMARAPNLCAQPSASAPHCCPANSTLFVPVHLFKAKLRAAYCSLFDAATAKLETFPADLAADIAVRFKRLFITYTLLVLVILMMADRLFPSPAMPAHSLDVTRSKVWTVCAVTHGRIIKPEKALTTSGAIQPIDQVATLTLPLLAVCIRSH